MSEQKRLDRPELREKMKIVTKHTLTLLNALDDHEGNRQKQAQDWFAWKDALEALIPDIQHYNPNCPQCYENLLKSGVLEEAKIIAYGKGIEDCTDNIHPVIVKNAKREERERIRKLIQGFISNVAAQRYKDDLLIYLFGQELEQV